MRVAHSIPSIEGSGSDKHYLGQGEREGQGVDLDLFSGGRHMCGATGD